jgi:hypothetical protein
MYSDDLMRKTNAKAQRRKGAKQERDEALLATSRLGAFALIFLGPFQETNVWLS